jgi:hypothetical protein
VLLHQTQRSEPGTDGLARTNLRFSREVVRKRGWRPSGTCNQVEISHGPWRRHLDLTFREALYNPDLWLSTAEAVARWLKYCADNAHTRAVETKH